MAVAQYPIAVVAVNIADSIRNVPLAAPIIPPNPAAVIAPARKFPAPAIIGTDQGAVKANNAPTANNPTPIAIPFKAAEANLFFIFSSSLNLLLFKAF